jgi:hypothetical protein
MRGLTVTFPALAFHTEFVRRAGITKKPAVGKQFPMAAYAVPVNNFTTGFMNENNLGFKPQSEHSGMTKTIFCLEIVFIKNIVMRHMAIVAVSLFTM